MLEKLAKIEAAKLAKTTENDRINTVLAGDETGFRISFKEAKGRIVRTTRMWRKGDVLLEYCGECYEGSGSMKKGKELEKHYEETGQTEHGCYLFFMK